VLEIVAIQHFSMRKINCVDWVWAKKPLNF